MTSDISLANRKYRRTQRGCLCHSRRLGSVAASTYDFEIMLKAPGRPAQYSAPLRV